MAARKTKAEETEEKMGFGAELEGEIDGDAEERVTMSLDDLRRLIAEEVRKAKDEDKAEEKGEARKLKHVKAKPARKVKIKLFKDNGRYSKPVFVAVNGKKYMVPRGVEVEVPEFIARVLDESFKQDMDTADQLMQLEMKFREDTRRLR